MREGERDYAAHDDGEQDDTPHHALRARLHEEHVAEAHCDRDNKGAHNDPQGGVKVAQKLVSCLGPTVHSICMVT